MSPSSRIFQRAGSAPRRERANVSKFPRKPLDENFVELDAQSVTKARQFKLTGDTLCSSLLRNGRPLAVGKQSSDLAEVSFGGHSLQVTRLALQRHLADGRRTSDNASRNRKQDNEIDRRRATSFLVGPIDRRGQTGALSMSKVRARRCREDR